MQDTPISLPIPPPLHEDETPFVIELNQIEPTPSGSFLPAASLKVTPALRTSGLLKAMPPEDVAWLVFLLTFLSPNGHVQAHLDLLTEAMHVSKQKVVKRMERLTSFTWQQQPLVNVIYQESGLVTYSLSPHVIHYEHSLPPASAPPSRIGGFRDEIIAHSRAMYSRPRAEVERMIDAQYGIIEPQTEEERAALELKRDLENAGVTSEQADRLIAGYDRERIERQLSWLPYRNAKSPAGFLIAAIEEDYAEPLSLRMFGDSPVNHDPPANPPTYE